ncbi:response regulator [Oscillatoria salina]|uniref:response regulator n=1 Tax=Oscillatoria salina TaxID=331517 RepID=UPI001CCB6FB8|nr:response regulator [Oscillatoria salina]MBZ8180264.1 response regulator [Oscillatoria salina IIICB1]
MSYRQDNVLIVDDTLENLQVLSQTLSKRGYKVRGAVKGEMAIRTAQSVPPDLILLDIKMPDMDGYEVCKCLKADERTKQIPIIFLSALDEVTDKVKGFQIGGVDYITKPFQVEEVLARIENQLTIQRLQKQLQIQNERLQEEIKERQKAEAAAKAASQAKSEFLANMSHELRTPLNAILGFTQVLRREPDLTPEQQDYLGIINRSSQHLLELINDVLDLSKIEAGRVSLNYTNFDLYRLLDQIEEMFHIKAETKNLTLEFRLAPEVPQYIRSDETKLRGCLINLLGNAVKFTELGQINLKVETQSLSPENDEIELLFTVQDTGTGIAPEEIQTLFDAFVQAEKGRQAAEGTGLGLSITKRFVELLGGEIKVSSVLDKGSIFQFYIKAKIADALAEIAQPTRRVVGLEPSEKKYRILVVDDTEENRLLLVKMLEPIGFQVREAKNGRKAIALWSTWQPHLILMDTRMPVMSGLEATKQIRFREKNQGKNKLQTIILALTASAFEERRGEIIAAGSDDFVRKPFTEETIFARIGERLGVSYIYEDLPSPHSSRQFTNVSRADSFYFSELAAMPPDWVRELYQAANTVREETIEELIVEIPPTQAALAEALKDLVYNFRLDEIVRLTKQVIEKS